MAADPPPQSQGVEDEKKAAAQHSHNNNNSGEFLEADPRALADRLGATLDDYLAAEQHARTLSLDECVGLARQLIRLHRHDANLAPGAVDRLVRFVALAEGEGASGESDGEGGGGKESGSDSGSITSDSATSENTSRVSNDSDAISAVEDAAPEGKVSEEEMLSEKTDKPPPPPPPTSTTTTPEKDKPSPTVTITPLPLHRTPSHPLLALGKTEVALMTTNSPYSEVRANVSPTDDPDVPCGTVRAWAIGLGFVVVLALVDQLFSVRQPPIMIGTHVVQLAAYPVGRLAARVLPDWTVSMPVLSQFFPALPFTISLSCSRAFPFLRISFAKRAKPPRTEGEGEDENEEKKGIRYHRFRLNPGPFTRKEHMLISIMAATGKALPASGAIVFTQWLPRYFDQPYAANFLYQILLALSTNLMGFGLAGFCRRFLVYPSFCMWPRSLVTIALNGALHNETNTPVPGPFNRIYTWSRYRLFLTAFLLMFAYFWLPGFLFRSLSLINWLAWIAPDNVTLNLVTGLNRGLGFNPFPSLDWNVISHGAHPLVVPFRITANRVAGALAGGLTIIGLYWGDYLKTARLPINTNTMYTDTGAPYNVSKILDDRAWLDVDKFEAYSPVLLTAGMVTVYYYFFAVYAATVSYAFLYHRHDIALGLRNLVSSFKSGATRLVGYEDVHSRMMMKYKEVPEMWYLALNVVAISLGCIAVGGWPTYTSLGAVFFGTALALVFLVPIGIIEATTAIGVELNVIAEFIGGSIQPGNALAMNFFKTFGTVTTGHALRFTHDLKLAHYVKLPPRQTFSAQVVAAVLSAFVSTAVMNFQIRNIEDLCGPNQKDHFTCPGVNSYFTASVLFGSVGARRVFGPSGPYSLLLTAFPLGLLLPVLTYYAQRRLPVDHWLAKIHPVAFLEGATAWAPYNIAYVWPALIPGWVSMVYLKRRFVAFWSKYNYVLSAALDAGIAIAGLCIFVAFFAGGGAPRWWGNRVETGCEKAPGCVLRPYGG